VLLWFHLGRQARHAAILNYVGQFFIRQATQDDAVVIGRLYDEVYNSDNTHLFAGSEAPTASTFSVLLQTGSFFLVAEWEGCAVGAIRTWDDEGVGWFDLLISGRGGAGRALLRAFESKAQDSGMRLVRARVADAPLFPEYFTRRGYQPIARETAPGGPIWTLERRLPLLTVREQRREDADAIAALTGEDPWPLSQGNRPGHFVLADGARIAGFIKVRDVGAGRARLMEPVLAEGYTSRKLEVWMIERAASDAGNRGFTTAEVGPWPALGVLRRDLEDRQWSIEGVPGRDPFVKRLGDGGGDDFVQQD
jgi:N-acetylglutamate synthase-like GNAT family acetyltransferase